MKSPGKLLFTANASTSDCNNYGHRPKVKTFIQSVTSTLPATPKRLEENTIVQQQDVTCSKKLARERECVRGPGYISESQGFTLSLLSYNDRIVVRFLLQYETLQRFH